MELTIDKVVGGGEEISNGGDTTAERVFVSGKAPANQPLIFHNDPESQVTIQADDQGNWTHRVDTSEKRSYANRVTTRDQQYSSNRWHYNKV